MNINIGNNTKNIRSTPVRTKTKLSKFDVNSMMNNFITGRLNENECLKMYNIQQQLFDKILHTKGAYKYLRLTEPFESFLIAIKKARAEKVDDTIESKVVEQESQSIKKPTMVKIKTHEEEIEDILKQTRPGDNKLTIEGSNKLYNLLYEDILLYKLDKKLEREISEILKISENQVNLIFKKWRHNIKTDEEKQLLLQINKIVEAKDVEAKAVEAKDVEAKDVEAKDVEAKDVEVNTDKIIDHGEPIKFHIEDMIEYDHRTHYLKWQIRGDISIRYHEVFQDKPDLVGKFILKDHESSTWEVISKRIAQTIIKGNNTDEVVEIYGYLNKGNYHKLIKPSKTSGWFHRNETELDKAHDERLSCKNWTKVKVLEKTFGFQRIIGKRIFTVYVNHIFSISEQDNYEFKVSIHDLDDKLLNYFAAGYEEVSDFIKKFSNLKNDQLFIPTKKRLVEIDKEYKK